MNIKDQNLYINEKNIATIQAYSNTTSYGLIINGINIKFGDMVKASKELQAAKLGKMKAYQTQIIKKIEK